MPDSQSQLASVNSSSSRSKKQLSASSSNKKKSTSEVEVIKPRSKKPRKASSNETMTEEASIRKPFKCNGGSSSVKDNLDYKIPVLLRDVRAKSPVHSFPNDRLACRQCLNLPTVHLVGSKVLCVKMPRMPKYTPLEAKAYFLYVCMLHFLTLDF